jgi:hypothetical protein
MSLLTLYETVSNSNDESHMDNNPVDNNPRIGFYAKFINKEYKDEEFEFQKFAEGKRPCGNCIIWGCTKKTTRKCKCGCMQFVCKECAICILK